MDCYRSSAHFANFQVRSSLNCSKKKPVVRSWKRALLKLQWFALFKIRALTPPPPTPPSVNNICMYSVKEMPPGRGGKGGGSSSTHNLWNRLKYVQIVHFYEFFNHFYGSIFEINLWITALFFPYMAHERKAQNLILSVRSSLFFLNSSFAPKIKVHSRAKREERLSVWAISKSDVPSSVTNTFLVSHSLFLRHT